MELFSLLLQRPMHCYELRNHSAFNDAGTEKLALKTEQASKGKWKHFFPQANVNIF